MYKQLSEEKRFQIWALRKEGKSQIEIAKALKVHRSTVSRELTRNTGPYGYDPKIAQRMAIYRKKFHQQIVGRQYEDLVKELVQIGWSADQCSEFIQHYHPELTPEQIKQLISDCQSTVIG
ncbi:helix-turn-helix domain-containing protein [Reinekea marinisedimentorum]|uniref:Helix-turn-helix protein n=1 Tax=Reinekea marinisedimentorum TaxID=230495 RepID=A0A4R3I5L1_9GAMM|nr:helix-turn-helix domain-containing protein [Reinekea marinisedimentorum]TCS41144.1 helix-turn-helix protein [Reinekea marinisedimentorum]